MEYNLDKLQKIRQKINENNSNEKPFIVVLYKEHGKEECEFPLTDEKENQEKREVFYLCSRKTYDNIRFVEIKDSYYVCDTLEEVETVASFIVEHYLDIFKEFVLEDTEPYDDNKLYL